MIEAVQALSLWTIPLVLAGIPTVALARGVRVYEVFCEGAKEGFETAVKILPYLVAMFVAIGVFRSSSALDALLGLIDAPMQALGIPPEVLPLALLRPLSGSGALGFLAGILSEHGPDSQIGLMASTMQGSTETTFYILTVYLGSVGVTRARHAVVVGLCADLAGFLASIAIAKAVFPTGL